MINLPSLPVADDANHNQLGVTCLSRLFQPECGR